MEKEEKKQPESLEEKLAGEFIELAKPNAGFKLLKADLDNVDSKFMGMYKGESVPGSKLQDAFNEVAKTYLQALFSNELKVDGPELYGNMIRQWSRDVSEQHIGQLLNAIKIGDRAKLLALLNEAYQAGANKVPSTISKIQSQEGDSQMKVYDILARETKGNKVKVATNLAGTYGALQQQYATQEQLS